MTSRPINKRSLKITLLGYFAALAMMATLLAIPVVFVIVLKAIFNA